MKVNKSNNGTVTIQAEGENVKAVFKELAVLEEVFCENKCGRCKRTDLRFVVRVVDDNEYYELHCKEPVCRAKLSFGAHKKGSTLFPHRKDKDGKYLPDNGWVKYVKGSEDKQEENPSF